MKPKPRECAFCGEARIERLVDRVKSGTEIITRCSNGEECKERQDFRDELKFLLTCCMKHPDDLDVVGQFAELSWWRKSVPDEDAGYALFALKDKRWAVLVESQDYTGHG